MTALAAALHGYFFRPTRLWERLFLFGAALVLIKPGLMTDLAGAALLGAVLISQQAFRSAPAPAAAEPRGE